jgi:hypothetical protein
MDRPRAMLVVAAAACVLTGTAASAQAAPTPVQLAGTTAITASGPSASTTVQLRKDVTFGGVCFEDEAVSVTGSADAVLVALHRVGGGTPHFIGRFPQRQGGSTFSSLCASRSSLAAGTYTLTALRSSGTAGITLRIPGLTGEASVRATRPSSATLVDLPPVSAYETTRGTVESFGATRELTSRGALAVAGWVDQAGQALLTMGVCDKKRSAESGAAVDAVDFAPGCPTGSSSSSLPGVRGEGVSYFASSYSDIEAASWGSSFYYVSQGPVVSAGALAAWIPFVE